MWGAIAGDIVGSVYEGRGRKIKHKDFQPLFAERARFTDDSVHAVAVMEALLNEEDMGATLHRYTRKYPGRGYGGWMRRWAAQDEPAPYGSYGNGSAMRAGACGWWARSIEEAIALAEASAAPTHDHPEGVQGTKAVAVAVFLARKGQHRGRMRHQLEKITGYNLQRTVDEIRPGYRFDVTCRGSVPQALICALESTSLEDAIRNAVSLGGDSDTLAAIAGSIAEAMWGCSHEMKKRCRDYLDGSLTATAERFEKTVQRIEELYIVGMDKDGRATGREDVELGCHRYEIWWSRGIGDRLKIWSPDSTVTGGDAWKACREVLDKRLPTDRTLREELVGKTLQGDRELEEHYERQRAMEREKATRTPIVPAGAETETREEEQEEPSEEEREAQAEAWLEDRENFDPTVYDPEELMETLNGQGWIDDLFNQNWGSWVQREYMPKRIRREMEALGDEAEYLELEDAVRLYPGLLEPWDSYKYHDEDPVTRREEKKQKEAKERTVIRHLETRAQDGSAEACYILSSVYMEAKGTSEEVMAGEAEDWAGKEGGTAQETRGWWFRMRKERGVSASEACKWAARSAEGGYPAGQRRYGALLWRLGETEHNESEPRMWFEKAAEGGDARAQHNMGELARRGCGEEEWPQEALEWYERAAAQAGGADIPKGDQEPILASSCALGRAAESRGEGEEARKWMRIAAVQGSVEGQTRYARMLQDGGDATQEDMHEAFTWLHLAAVQGEPVAQTNLGLAYCHGDGIEADEETGQAWLAEAAEQGYEYAAEVLTFRRHIARSFDRHGALWLRGTGRRSRGKEVFKVGGPPGTGEPTVEAAVDVAVGERGRAGKEGRGNGAKRTRNRKEERSDTALRQEAEAGNAEAQMMLGEGLLMSQEGEEDWKEGGGWMEAAARQGKTEAMVMLGACYERGWGRRMSAEQAARWYKAAARKGNVTGLGALVAVGCALPPVEDIQNIEEQVAAGSPHAKYALAVYLDRGEGIDEDKKRAKELWREAAREGEPESCWMLSTMEKDAEASRLCLEAARDGVARAQVAIGLRLEKGQGIRKSKKGARAMLASAARQHDPEAKDALKRMDWEEKVQKVLEEVETDE